MTARAREVLLCAALAGVGAGGCSDDPLLSSGKGTATIEFAPLPVQVSGLSLTAATMHVDEIILIGNVPPPGPPPPGLPPPEALPRFDFDVLSAAGHSVDMSWLPQGLYSRIAFKFERVSFRGVWQGTPFSVSLDWVMSQPVSLRSPTPEELGPGMDVAFRVVLDPSAWFAGGVLDSGTVAGGTIVFDGQQNTGAAITMLGRIAPSFSLP